MAAPVPFLLVLQVMRDYVDLPSEVLREELGESPGVIGAPYWAVGLGDR
jgi:hypothetical protein